MKSCRIFFCLLLFAALALCARAENDGIHLTFNRTGSDVGSVSVTVAGEGSVAPSDVSATLVSTSFDALKTAGAEAITNGSVLAPNSYANGEGSQISYLFCIEGLSSAFTFNTVEVDVYALTANGTAQYNNGSTVRYFQFQSYTGSTPEVTLFAEKKVDTDICTVPNQTNGLYHSLQTMKAEQAAGATNPLYLQVTLTKTSALGCYAGIGMVSLLNVSGEEEDTTTVDEGFVADKYYTIHRNNNTSAYIYQNGNVMGTSSLSAEKSFWWVLEPTENKDCYYIKNATTGDYVQSAVQTLSSLVPMGKEPVEFQIKKDETPGAATAGYYYMASTDQTISVQTDGTLGLNFGATGIVAYYIRTGRGNSYWEIEESEYAYNPPTVETTDYARAIQLYSVPCGNLGKAYLSATDIEGSDILTPLHYSATASPAHHHLIYTEQKVAVRQGGKLPVSIAVANADDAIRAFAYADWDHDGVFEQSVEFQQDKATIAVPSDVAVGRYRLRIRVTETETTGAEDDVIGMCYDFIVNVVSAEASLTWSVESNDESRGTATGALDGGTLKVKATPKGDATFLGWRLMDSYFTGRVISTDAEMELPLNRSMRLVALFSPNTQDVVDGIPAVGREADQGGVNDSDNALYDINGRRIPVSSIPQKGVYIKNGKKQLITK